MRYREVLVRVGEATDLGHEEAEVALLATARAVTDALPGPAADRVLLALPPEISAAVPSTTTLRLPSPQAFVERVAELEGVGADTARRHALHALSALSDAIPPRAADALRRGIVEAPPRPSADGPLADTTTSRRGKDVVLLSGESLEDWRMAGAGSFEPVDGAVETRGGMGLLWYSALQFRNFLLDVEWQATKADDNSGVFLRFPDPGNDPWVAVERGYEVQIHDAAERPVQLTGAIYGLAPPRSLESRPPGDWNHARIRAQGHVFLVTLNGVEVTRYVGGREPVGYVGLQNHDEGSTVRFRLVRARILA